MKKLYYTDKNFEQSLKSLYDRAPFPPEAEKAAADIIADVRRDGDKALIKFAEKFDHIQLTPESMVVSEEEIKEACRKLSAADKRAVRKAFEQRYDSGPLLPS